MRSWWPSLLLSVAACSPRATDNLGGAASASREGGQRIVRLQLFDYSHDLRTLRAMGLDVLGVSIQDETVEVLAGASDLATLDALGYPIVETLPLSPRLAANGLGAPLDPQYQTPESVQKALRTFAQQFPGISAVSSIGKSFEGRDIWAIRISSDVGTHHPEKPVILFNAMHHAREVMSTEVAMDTITQLLTRYGSDPNVTHWVDSDEIWIVPMFNVDGNNKVWTVDTLWRKNTDGQSGVDINRNYPYAWNSCNGSSADPGAEDYRGAAAASEPETQVMMGLVEEIRPVFDISYHSYSELVLYPYGCDGAYTNIRPVVEGIGKAMAALIPSDTGSGAYTPGTPWEVLYAVDGDDIDWMFHDQNVLPYVIELNSMDVGFQPSYAQWRDATVTKLRPAWQYLLQRLDGSGIRGSVTLGGTPASGATVSLTSGTGPAQTRAINPDGSFHFVLNPGTYQLSASVPGQPAQTRALTVADARVDVQLAF